jgi:putative membrane protein
VKKLILAVDIDDDLGKKAGVIGPVIGREENLNAAIRLAIEDPEDPDANVIFKAISIYDSFKKENEDMEIITLTGDSRLGIAATSKISKQLDRVMNDFPATACFMVTDGASDDSVIPVIQSRLKIDGVYNLYIKQARELEKTYFVIIEKLKDPTYAKILIGGPAILMLLASLAYIYSIPWQYIGFLLGSILLVKGFGIDSRIEKIMKSIEIRKNKSVNAIFYLFIFTLLGISLIAGYNAYLEAGKRGLAGIEMTAYSISAMANILLVMFMMVLLAKFIEFYTRNSMINLVGTVNNAIIVIASFFIVKIGAQWITNIESDMISFGSFIELSSLIIIAAYIVVRYLDSIKADIIMNSIEGGANAIMEDGSLIGLVVGVEAKEQAIIIKTQLNKITKFPVDKVSSIAQNKDIIIEE